MRSIDVTAHFTVISTLHNHFAHLQEFMLLSDAIAQKQVMLSKKYLIAILPYLICINRRNQKRLLLMVTIKQHELFVNFYDGNLIYYNMHWNIQQINTLVYNNVFVGKRTRGIPEVTVRIKSPKACIYHSLVNFLK